MTSIRERQLYELRIYEGEHAFMCQCGGKYVEYSFEGEYNHFLETQEPPRCHRCGFSMQWAGWSGQSDITSGIVSLIQGGHLMSSIIIIAAFIEYQIDNLLWAILVDTGLSIEKASKIANGTLPRGDAIRMIRDLLGSKVLNVLFPLRNDIAHGRAFGKHEGFFHDAVQSQINAIEKWVSSVAGGNNPTGYDYYELDRWILSMHHWVYWFKKWYKLHKQVET